MKIKDGLYKLTQNNYVTVFFLSVVMLSLAYIIHHEMNVKQPVIDPTMKMIETPSEFGINETIEMTDEIKVLMQYINPLEDINTSYQSIFNDRKVSINDLSDGDKLYIAYKYLEKTVDFNRFIVETNYDTFHEQLDKVSYESNLEKEAAKKKVYYRNTYITKDHLNEAVKRIFGVNIEKYENFSGAICYLKNNNYVCMKDAYPKSHSKIEFVKAYYRDYYLDIVVKYNYVDNGIKYYDFYKDKIGDVYYKVTFENIDGTYYFDSADITTLEN